MSGTKGTPTAPVPLNGVQVAVHMDHEQYPTPQASHHDSYLNMEKDMEIDAEK